MTANYEIASDGGITVITMMGEVTRNDIIDALHETVANHTYECRLWDFTRIEFDLSIDEMRQISDVSKSLIDGPNRVAFAVGDPLTYGKIRQYMVYRTGEQTVIRVFMSYSEAYSWLAKEGK